MPVKVLVDPVTGEQFQVEIPETGGNGDGTQSEQQQSQQPSTFHRNQPMGERQIETLFANKERPKEIKEKYWGLGPKLAVTKITDSQEYYRFKLRVENVLRVQFLDNDADDMSLLDMELMDLDAKLDLARSQTDDYHASLLELVTTLQQTQRQHIDNHPVAGQSSGLIGAIAGRILGRGRR